MKPGCRIYSQACPLFVPLVEEGWKEHRITSEIAGVYLDGLRGKIDALILACTHYPLIKDVISRTIGKEVDVIDSASEVAKDVDELLRSKSLQNISGHTGNTEFYVSDDPEIFKSRSGIFLGFEPLKVGRRIT